MTPRERRSFALASCLLLVASLARWGWERRRPPPLLPSDSAGIRGALLAETRRARAEAERRSRPLAEAERIDPNRAPAAELDRLPGVGPAVAEALVRERERGGPFRDPDDLRRVRGIGSVTAARIAAHLDFSRPPPALGAAGGAARAAGSAGSRSPPSGFRPLVAPAPAEGEEEDVVDLNAATADELEGLRGIGPALSARIVELRLRRGRFERVEELLDVRGIGPATLERIRDRVRVPP